MKDLKGELFTATWSFAGIAVIRLLSSVILTRLLYPEAFGLITILFSIVFVVEMLADAGIQPLLIRHEKSETAEFYNTFWTIKVLRGLFNGMILLFASPYVAELYGVPELANSLQIFSVWFVLAGLESVSYAFATRHKKTQIINLTQLGCVFISSSFSIIYCYFDGTHMGMVYGALLDRALMTIASYRFYTTLNHRFLLDREAFVELFNFAKYVVPSSLISMVIVQFDKIIFLRFFSLELLGVYGLAGNISAPLNSYIDRISHTMLFPRLAEDYRRNQDSFLAKYYLNHARVHAALLVLPALLCGIAPVVVELLYDDRYAVAGVVLQAFAVRSLILVIASTSEDLLVASGRVRIQFYGNIIRIAWVIPALICGYLLFGFEGFVVAAMLEMLPTCIFYYSVQARHRIVIWRYEAARTAFVLVLVGLSVALAMFARIFLLPLLPT